MLTVTEAWKATFPGAVVGVLAMRDVSNQGSHPELEARKRQLENDLRSSFEGLDRSALRRLERLQAYDDYYRPHKKTYHVLLQLESILKGKPIPSVTALVEANFMAELKNFLLTAGHDRDAVESPITLDVSKGDEEYMQLTGNRQVLKQGDMVIGDAQGVMSCILYGPDRRARITPDTRRVLYTTYAPRGIGEEAVRRHLGDIRDNILLAAPEAQVDALDLYSAT